jgi:hypothetical protein
MRAILLAAACFAFCGNPARSETLDTRQAKHLVAQYLFTSDEARMYAALCRPAPASDVVGPTALVSPWHGASDVEWMDKQAVEYQAMARVLVEKIKQAVPAKAAEAEASFQRAVEVFGARTETLRQSLASMIKSPDELPLHCGVLRQTFEAVLPSKVPLADVTVVPE